MRNAPRSGMKLSKLDKQALQDIVSLVIRHTGIKVTEDSLRYQARDITRQLSFGGDFTYRFGDLFKLVFVRYGTRRSEEDAGKYDILFHLAVELDNASGMKDDEVYRARRNIADKAEEKLEEYLKNNGLAVELKVDSSPVESAPPFSPPSSADR